MWNGQSSVPTVSGGTQDSQLQHRVQHRTFPHFPSDHTPLLVRPHAQQQGVPLLTPRCPSGHTAGPGPAPLRAERPPLPQGLISVSEVETKSPDAQCRVQIGSICSLCTFLGRDLTREPEEHVCCGRGTIHAQAKWLMISCEPWVEYQSRGQVQPTSHFLLFQPD